MSIFLIKSILAILFLAAGFTAFLTMMTLMGKLEKKMNPVTLRRIHKAAGAFFGILLLGLSFLCIRYLVAAGDKLSTRAVFHSVLSLFLVVIFFIKVSIVRFFRQFLKYVPGFGMAVFSLAFVVTLLSAGYYFLRPALRYEPAIPNPAPLHQAATAGNPARGQTLFEANCSACHYPDQEKTKSGPGLKGILKKENLPASGRPAIVDNIRKQLKTPYLAMPSFSFLSEQEIADLLAFLQTL
jgi:mono/diheme cytochrome c family protein